MSRKNENGVFDLSTEDVYKFTGLLTSRGAENPSDLTLVAVSDRRPISLRERIRRYTGRPALESGFYDEFEDDDALEMVDHTDRVPDSPYTASYKEKVKAAKTRLAELENDKKIKSQEKMRQLKKLLADLPDDEPPAPPEKTDE